MEWSPNTGGRLRSASLLGMRGARTATVPEKPAAMMPLYARGERKMAENTQSRLGADGCHRAPEPPGCPRGCRRQAERA